MTQVLPREAIRYRLRTAYIVEEWETVAAEIIKADSRGWMSDDWLATLGQALGTLRRFPEAISAYERITPQLSESDQEYARIYNFAYALDGTGDLDGDGVDDLVVGAPTVTPS